MSAVIEHHHFDEESAQRVFDQLHDFAPVEGQFYAHDICCRLALLKTFGHFKSAISPNELFELLTTIAMTTRNSPITDVSEIRLHTHNGIRLSRPSPARSKQGGGPTR